MVSTMRPGTGRVGVVMPHGALFRGGKEAETRRWMIEQNKLEALIGLPNNLFYSTTIPVALMIFRDAKLAGRQNKVLFIDARQRFKAGKNQNTLTRDHVDVISAAYHEGTDTTEKSGPLLHLVERAEIEGKDWDLNIGGCTSPIQKMQDTRGLFRRSRQVIIRTSR